jgi:hypothetical protein
VGAHRLGQDEQYLTVREILFRARSQMARYHASAAIFSDLGMQRWGLLIDFEKRTRLGTAYRAAIRGLMFNGHTAHTADCSTSLA